jgi:hypothetical protein
LEAERTISVKNNSRAAQRNRRISLGLFCHR